MKKVDVLKSEQLNGNLDLAFVLEQTEGLAQDELESNEIERTIMR